MNFLKEKLRKELRRLKRSSEVLALVDEIESYAYEAGVTAFLKYSESCRITALTPIGDKLYVELGEMDVQDSIGVSLVPISALEKLKTIKNDRNLAR